MTAILSYRDTAPLDSEGGTQIAVSMAQAIISSPKAKWEDYPKMWMDINHNNPSTLTAAAVDVNGYWFINHEFAPASSTHDMRPLPGFESKLGDRVVVGPGRVPNPEDLANWLPV